MNIGRLLGLAVGVAFCGVLITLGVTQEVPVGRLEGRLTMQENGKPIPDAVVSITPVGPADEDRPRGRGIETRADGSFRLSNLPVGEYDVELSAKEHSLKKRRIEIDEAKTQTLDLVAEPNEPYLNLYASQRVFTPDETPKVELHGFVSTPNVKVAVYRLDVAEVAKQGGLDQTLSPFANPDGGAEHHLDRLGERVEDLSHPIERRDAEGAFVEALPVGRLAEGYYFVTCSSGDKRASTELCVTRLALVTKSYLGKSLCFATDIRTGQPVAGVEIFSQGSGALRSVGTTDATGLVEVRLPSTRDVPNVLVGRQGGSVALVGVSEGDRSRDKVKIYGYCERPAYRPGDLVQFKGIVRRVSVDGYRLPGRGTASIEIDDPDGNKLEEMSAPISIHGTFSGSFTTSPESKPGSYTIKCRAFGGESDGIGANVVAYRKPEYSIEVTPDRPYYVMGNRASATVECRYYYGGPVVGATVKATISRSPAFILDSNEDDDESGDGDLAMFGGGGEYSQAVNVVTDASGKARIPFDTKADNDPDEFSNDYAYDVSVSVSEDEGKSFDGSGQVRVVRGEYDLDAQVLNPVVSPGEKVDLLIRTMDVLDRHKPVPNRTVTVEAGREEWTGRTSVFISKGTYQVVTGADGTVHLPVPVDGEYSMAFRVRSKDDDGHPVVAGAYAYVEGSPAQAESRKGTLKLTLDHKKYVPGDRGRVLVQTDMPGGSALVCVQAAGILWRQVVPITSVSTVVNFPVTKEEAPNAYVSVSYVREKHFLRADRQLRVNRTDRDLHVVVKTDRDVYRPGETAQVTLQTLDSAGRPAPADVSVGVVDAGVYDIAEDDTDIQGALYPRRSDEVRTDYSFPVIYLDGGDKGSSKVPLRTRFRDTASWTPSVWTGPTGTATVPVELPDNLTAWRVTAVGISDASLVGLSKLTFHARKDLMIRLELPQYLVDGDRQRMTVVVTNDTGRDQDVNVQLAGEGVTLDETGDKIVRVPNGHPQVVEYQMRAGGPGTATLTAKAWVEGGPNDGVRQSFPIEPHGRKLLDAKSGQGSADVSLPIRSTADPKYGSLEIKLSPTLAGGLVSSLDELIGFPYGCVEQTMSRFMPSVLVAKTVKDLGLPQPAHLAELPQIVRDSLARLDKMRHDDGGWGWWEYDESSPFMTALVLDGLDRAKSAGWNVDVADATKAVTWGLERLKTGHAKVTPDASTDAASGKAKKPKMDLLRDRLYLAYGLLRWGKSEAAAALDGLNLAKMSPVELATAALAFHAADRPRDAEAALERLRKSAEGEASGLAYWPPEDNAWGEESTSMVLVAFEAVAPDDPIVPQIVRGIMNARVGDMWQSTRDTAYALVGLTTYLGRSHELNQTSTADVSVNGVSVATITLDPKVAADPRWTLHVLRAQLGAAGAHIEIKNSGPGACYYALRLQTLDVAPELNPESTDKGLQVVRRYYRLEPRALENGTTRLLPTVQTVDKFASGDLVRVEITITSDVPRQFVMIEEPTPSSCRVAERDDPGDGEQWSWWWSRTLTLDDRIAFFATYLPKGTSKIAYTMRAEQPSQVRALPTKVANMYDPSTTASSGENSLEVTK